jgi:hypothetical protein
MFHKVKALKNHIKGPYKEKIEKRVQLDARDKGIVKTYFFYVRNRKLKLRILLWLLTKRKVFLKILEAKGKN